MKIRLPLVLVFAGLVGAAGFAVAMNARAQQSVQSDPSSNTTRGHGEDRGDQQRFSPADRAAFFDARVAAMHAGLTLTPDQEKLWPAVESALRDTAKTMAEQRKVWRDEPRPSDPVQMLQRISQGSIARGEALKKLADAAAPLYATLSDEQKHRLPIFLAHFRPHGMHFAMMGERRLGGPDGGQRGWSHDRHDHDGDEDEEHGSRGDR